MGSKAAIFSFFSGAGFLDLGFENSGFDVCFVNEYDPLFLRAHFYARQNMNIKPPRYGYHEQSAADFLEGQSAKKLKGYVKAVRKTHDLVGFIAGPPCPDFSVAGKNRGAEGAHGQLTGAYIELILKQQPDFFVFENVKGLWSNSKHKMYYNYLLAKLEAAGYKTYDKLVNALEYGVPQDRNRVILLGFKTEVFDEYNSQFPWEKYAQHSKEELMQYEWPNTDSFAENISLVKPRALPLEITCQYWFTKNQVDRHPNGTHHFKPHAMSRFLSIQEGNVQGKSFKRLHRWRYSPTCAYGNNEVHLHPYKARRISAAEALALQSLPKEFVLPPDMTLSAMFKIIGNGVPYKMAEGIALTVKDFLINNGKEAVLNTSTPKYKMASTAIYRA